MQYVCSSLTDTNGLTFILAIGVMAVGLAISSVLISIRLKRKGTNVASHDDMNIAVFVTLGLYISLSLIAPFVCNNL